MMIGDVTFGASDLPRAAAFYDALLAELGAKDEGPAGPRGDGFHAGDSRDPDGSKRTVLCMS